MPINVALRALISGETPKRTDDSTLIGKVVEPGPLTNWLTTTSSNDNASDRNQAAATAGAMFGKVTRTKASNWLHPKSRAASSRAHIKVDQPRRNHHRCKGHREGDVRDDQRLHPSGDIEIHEEQQQRDACDHLGHHQRRVDHAGEQRSPKEHTAPAPALPPPSSPAPLRRSS